MQNLFYLFSILIMITACKKRDTGFDNNLLAAKKLLNEPYGGDSAQKMDIYLPTERTSDKHL